ncbi:hypothetical protein RHMOL_Rhmol03G0113900 [Rhododendron molle]|uniref:Uncharacterized protein n=1 Tax=Rhododendron molle TaxID=49168 RepID=A0ACC0PCV7_RHOML|nr:hypothetical protein RHMOL_Rhmol03G0113900 [Rhododendron molle]
MSFWHGSIHRLVIWKERNDDVFNHKKVDPLTSYPRGITIKAGIPLCSRRWFCICFSFTKAGCKCGDMGCLWKGGVSKSTVMEPCKRMTLLPLLQ